jgi:hypothetical protein
MDFDRDTKSSLIIDPAALAASPMYFLPRRVGHSLDATIRRLHHAYPGERRGVVALSDNLTPRFGGFLFASPIRALLQNVILNTPIKGPWGA